MIWADDPVKKTSLSCHRPHLISLMAAVAFLCAMTSGLVRAADSADACLLFSQADASGLLLKDVSPGISRAATLPAGSSCRYTYSEGGEVYGLTLVHCTDATIAEEGVHDSAAEVMSRQLRARKGNETASSLLRILPAMGDEAFWDGTSLWMRKGAHLVRITPNPHLEGAYADMAAADAARRESSLGLAVQASETILPRLP